ncbi:MAG: ATP synthase F1 subunit epsilon [Bacteroidia bacterium]|nr:ATP synthase F1 subunit epsilon [Bacteroidia bacterium]
MRLEIIKPDKKLYEGEAKSIVIPDADGKIGVLNNHAPLIASLKRGTIKVTEMNGNVQLFEINGGTVEVLRNGVIILAE